jgi:hypothetical protein
MALGFAVGSPTTTAAARASRFFGEVDRKHVTVDAVHYIETEDKAAISGLAHPLQISSRVFGLYGGCRHAT